MNPVVARHLTKYFNGFSAIDDVSFDVYPGECLGILGPNGAGKTTLLRLIIGQARLTHGDLEVLGHALPLHAEEMRARMGVVPQMDNLDVDFTVKENLFVYANYFGLKRKAIASWVEELLAFSELTEKADTPVHALSGGMKRRLVLARSLINHPELLILDEPTTGLDPQARHLIWQRLKLLKNQGTTQILTTHNMEEAERLCDRILILDHGKILAQGSPRGLIQQHIEPHVIEIDTSVLDDPAIVSTLPVLRSETVGLTFFGYLDNETILVDLLQEYSGLEFIHRHANLEDVFMKLTGRELQEP